MKRFTILFILLPTLLFAQQDSTKQIFKIGGLDIKPGDCTPVLSGKYYGNTMKVSLLELLKHPTIELKGCGDSAKIISFSVLWVDDNKKEEGFFKGDSIYGIFDRLKPGDFFTIKYIKYLQNGKIKDCLKPIVTTIQQ